MRAGQGGSGALHSSALHPRPVSLPLCQPLIPFPEGGSSDSHHSNRTQNRIRHVCERPLPDGRNGVRDLEVKFQSLPKSLMCPIL